MLCRVEGVPTNIPPSKKKKNIAIASTQNLGEDSFFVIAFWWASQILLTPLWKLGLRISRNHFIIFVYQHFFLDFISLHLLVIYMFIYECTF